MFSVNQMKREISNLGDWWSMSTKIKKIKKKILLQAERKRATFTKKNNLTKHYLSLNKDLLNNNKDQPSIYCYKLENQSYFDMMELLDFIKHTYDINYEQANLNEKQKQELKMKLNLFFSKSSM